MARAEDLKPGDWVYGKWVNPHTKHTYLHWLHVTKIGVSFVLVSYLHVGGPGARYEWGDGGAIPLPQEEGWTLRRFKQPPKSVLLSYMKWLTRQ